MKQVFWETSSSWDSEVLRVWSVTSRHQAFHCMRRQCVVALGGPSVELLYGMTKSFNQPLGHARVLILPLRKRCLPAPNCATPSMTRSLSTCSSTIFTFTQLLIGVSHESEMLSHTCLQAKEFVPLLVLICFGMLCQFAVSLNRLEMWKLQKLCATFFGPPLSVAS